MTVSSETAQAIAYAYREVEAARTLLKDVEAAMASSSFDQRDIRDAFGRRHDGLQLGVPSGAASHRIFNVPFSMCRPIIEAHIANQMALIQLYSEKALIEVTGGNGDVVPTCEPVNSGGELDQDRSE
jgi:hypothetical protein